MPVPPYDNLMLPILKLTDEKVWYVRDLVARVADDLQLTLDERVQLIPSGSMTLINSRVHWAKTYLKQAGLVEQPRRAYVQISKKGREVLAKNPTKIDNVFLQQFDEFLNFLSRTKPQQASVGSPVEVAFSSDGVSETELTYSKTPEEQISSASLTLDEAVRDALLERILECSPAFFEKLIIDLLIKMGYGGSQADAGQQLGRSGDGGVDGVIREDQLGLDRIFLQAKRNSSTTVVGSEIVQAFMGALLGKGAQKGVLITTSTFSKPAVQVAMHSAHLRIILIDGAELTKLMVRFGVGVRVARVVEVKRIDLDYFESADLD